MPNRRDFLKITAAAVGGFAVGAGALYAATSAFGNKSSTATENLSELSTLVVGINQSGIDTLDPALSNDGDGSYLPIANAYQTLLGWEYPDFYFTTPLIASSVTQGSDGVTWTGTVNSAAKFATGDPVTAADVVYSWQRAIGVAQGPQNTAGGWFGTMQLNEANNITAVDSNTVQWKLDKATQPGLVQALLTTIAFEIVNQKQTTPNATGNDYGHAWMDQGNSAGTGPFVISSWEKETQIILNRNENYWGPKPALKQVILKHVADADAELLLLQKGEIDVAWDLTPSQIQTLSSSPGLVSSSRGQAVLYWIWMNVAQKPFDNPLVWQAVKYSIDYDGLIQTLLNGQAINNQTLSLQGLPGYNPATPFSKNPTMAKSLLTQAGYPNGISATLNVSSTNSVAQITAAKVQSDMAASGITITLNSITDAEIFTNWTNGDFQMASDWWGGGLQSIMNFIPTWIIPAAGLAAKWSSWNDPTAIALAEQTYTAPTDAAAAALYMQITNYCLDNAPFAILWQMVYAVGMSSGVVGLTVPYSRLFIDFSKVYKQSVSGYTPTS